MDLIETIRLVTKSHEDIISILINNDNDGNKHYSFLNWIESNHEGYEYNLLFSLHNFYILYI